jgi:hypothetical protein
MTYYNTNKESGEVLQQSRTKTETQEDKIMELFTMKNRKLTADQVWTMAFKRDTLLTSVRRGITTLVGRGMLAKTPETVEGFYGKQVHYYSLPYPVTEEEAENQLNLFEHE